MRHTFFVSYSSVDKAKVDVVRAEIESLGESVWLDQEQILAGDAIASRISEGLGDSEHFVLFVSSSWMRSNWTKAEFNSAIYLATNSGNQKVFVVRLDATPLDPILASRRAIVFSSARQVAKELIGAIRARPAAGKASWQLLTWDSIGDRYLTSLAGQVLDAGPTSHLMISLGDRTLRMDLVDAVARDRIVIEDLRGDLTIYRALIDVIAGYRVELAEGALAKFGPGYQLALRRKVGELDECRDRLRATLQSLSPRLWAREERADALEPA